MESLGLSDDNPRVESRSPKPKDSTIYWAIDCVGLGIASYFIIVIFWFVGNVSHTPSEFSYLSVLLLFASYVLAYAWAAKRLGNTRNFGALAISAAAIGGSLVHVFVAGGVWFVVSLGKMNLSNAIFGLVLTSPVIAIVGYLVAQMFRLVSAGIAAHFVGD